MKCDRHMDVKTSSRSALCSDSANFQKYFELGQDESASPFLNKLGRSISQNIHLKGAICSAFFLLFSFFLSLSPLATLSSLALIPLAFVYLISGTPAFISAIEDVFIKKNINIDVLMAFSGFAACFIGHPYEGALLFVLFTLAESLEEMVTLKAKSSLLSIYEMAPTKAFVVQTDYSISEKSVYDIEIGTHLLVRSGEIVPLDGIVIGGSGSFSAAHVTGESRVFEIQVGEKIASGCKITQGSVTIEVTTKQADSTVSRIIKLIIEAEGSKPKYALTFERFGQIYSLSVIAITFLLPFILSFFFGIPLQGNEGSLIRAISFLITASPCALFIAVPIAYLSALSSSVASGAILKGGTVFDQLIQCSTVIFDKTGTLTNGILQLFQFFKIEQVGDDPFIAGIGEKEALSLAASIEQHAIHPIAKAIIAHAQEEKVPLFKAFSVEQQAGIGVSGYIEAYSARFYVEVRSPTSEEKEKIESHLRSLGTFDLVGPFALISIEREKQNRALFFMTFTDFLRKESFDTVTLLQKSGKEVMLLSGDHHSVAKEVALMLGIKKWKGNLRPNDKLQAIIELTAQSSNRGVVMVGDGINDAPALARADVGISMGQFSSASAKDVADIILLHDQLQLIPELFHKAQKTRKIVIQNIFVAIFSIAIGTFSSIFGYIPLWISVLLHEGSTLIVGMNALRLLQRM